MVEHRTIDQMRIPIRKRPILLISGMVDRVSRFSTGHVEVDVDCGAGFRIRISGASDQIARAFGAHLFTSIDIAFEGRTDD